MFFASPRAAEFCAKDSRQLADWFSDVGLDMYTDIVERNLASGERLVTMVAANNNALFAVSRVLEGVCVCGHKLVVGLRSRVMGFSLNFYSTANWDCEHSAL